MQSVTITRPVLIKVKVTEGYKKAIAAEIQQAIGHIDMQLQHMEFQARRMIVEMEKQNPQGIPTARQQLEKERKTRLEARQKLLEKLKEIGNLAPGEEVVHAQVESIVELKVGDDWRQVIGVEVVLEDNKVIEIRSRNI